MDEDRDLRDAAVTGPATDVHSGGWLSRRARAAIAAVGVVFAVLLLGVLVDYVTASPALCTACHEMGVRADSWKASAHGSVACVRCHQPARAWYDVPERLVDRGKLLSRDVAAHLSGDYRDPVDFRISGAATVPDAVCLQCHDPNRKATSGLRILIDHVEHAKRNGSCVSCHVRTAHPIETRGTALSLMSQCFTCHGQAAKPKASAECLLCHPEGYELLPQSHRAQAVAGKPVAWKDRHGAVAKQDIKQCEMCHSKKLCDDCHGIEMPHPMGWGKTAHGAAAKAAPESCSTCHGAEPNFCQMCHHEDYRPNEGPWMDQHPKEVMKRGTAYCMTCHSDVACTRCHMDRFGESPR